MARRLLVTLAVTVLALGMSALPSLGAGRPGAAALPNAGHRVAAAVPNEGVPAFGNVFVIIGENTGLDQVRGKHFPYVVHHLKHHAAWLTGYEANAHDSLADYIAMTSGQFTNCHQKDHGPDVCHQDVPNIFSQLDGAGIPWLTWEESATTTCDLTFISGSDAELNRQYVGHNPAVYYDNIEGEGGVWSATDKSDECNSNVIPAGTTGPNDTSYLDAALASGDVARFNYIVPNLCEDGHDKCGGHGRLRQFDSFLAREVPKIKSSPAFGSDGVLFTLFDEANEYGHTTSGGRVMFAVNSPLAQRGMYGGYFDHYSFLRTLEDGFGLGEYLANARHASPINSIWKD